tara:strand:+ start:438 stop:890 length:453 start_codon:yes stop_codon:yes gene_type:complete
MRQFGFSLLELLVALLVVAIMASLALPLYDQYAERTYRREGQAGLLGCAQALERRAAATFSYGNVADTDGDGVGDSGVGPLAASVCESRLDGRYRLSVVADEQHFTLTATAIGRMLGDGDLRLDSNGYRGWDKNANGTFEPSLGEANWDE